MVFLTLLAIPALVALGFLALGGRRVSLKEFLVHMAVMLVFTGACMGIIYWRNTGDVEHINGQVVSKKMERVSCRHPYCCMTCQSCSTDSKGHTSCYDYCCMTCYDHPFDQDWNVYSNVQRAWSIDTLDRQGLREPPRWTSTQVGEPVSWLHSYENYIKAAPGTLFRRDIRDDEKKFPLPPREPKVFDYWHTRQLVQVGVSLPDAARWNEDIEAVNGQVGPDRQANVVVVVVLDQPREYFEALQGKWLGGKKNDVAAVIGVDRELNIQWADVMAWSYNEMIRVSLRDELAATGKLDRSQVLTLIRGNVLQHFQRKHMRDFKYLTASFAPTGTQYAVCIILGALLSIGLGVFFYVQDVFGDEDSGVSSRRRNSYY